MWQWVGRAECFIETTDGHIEDFAELSPCAWRIAGAIFLDRFGVNAEGPAPDIHFRSEQEWTENGENVRGTMDYYSSPPIEVSSAVSAWRTFHIIVHEFLHYLIRERLDEAEWRGGDDWVDSEVWCSGCP